MPGRLRDPAQPAEARGPRHGKRPGEGEPEPFARERAVTRAHGKIVTHPRRRRAAAARAAARSIAWVTPLDHPQVARQVACSRSTGRLSGSREYYPDPGETRRRHASQECSVALGSSATAGVELQAAPRRCARRDVEVVPVAPVRRARSTPTDGAVRGDGWVGEVERVGGRRRLRGEVVMLAAAWCSWQPPCSSHGLVPCPPALRLRARHRRRRRRSAAVPPPAVTSAPTVVPTPTYAPIPPTTTAGGSRSLRPAWHPASLSLGLCHH